MTSSICYLAKVLEFPNCILLIYQIYFLLILHLVLLRYLCLLTFLIVHFRGTAKISFPCSKAKSAVIKLPLFSAASVTITPWLSPAMILFLCGKFSFFDISSGAYSVIANPPLFIISINNFVFSFG